MNFQTYHIESFGCQMNLSDSERIANQLESLGCVQCETKNNADVIVINTCCVRESAENRIFGHIGALKQIKEQRPDTVIIVSGCLARRSATYFPTRFSRQYCFGYAKHRSAD